MFNTQKLPYSAAGEAAVIAGVLTYPEVIGIAREILRPEDFYSKKNRPVYEAMIELDDNNEAIDIVTVADKLKIKGLFGKIGAVDYFTEIMLQKPLMSSFKKYCTIVRDKALLRALITVSEQNIEACYKDYDSVREVLDHAEQRIFKIAGTKEIAPFKDSPAVITDSIRKIQENVNLQGKLTGLSTGFTALDWLYTLGLQKGNLIILGARPGMGKTSMALNIITHVLLKENGSVAFFSLEMTALEVGNRMIVSHSKTALTQTVKGTIDQSGYQKCADSARKLFNTHLYIDDSGEATMADIRRKCRRLKADKGLDLVVIDHLQLLRATKKTDSRYYEISEISRALKAMAKELDVPVLCLSQLSRGVESRKDHKPLLCDLRESGTIEQDADVVLLLHRESYYDKSVSPHEGELIIAKNRNGNTGSVKLIWQPEYVRFCTG